MNFRLINPQKIQTMTNNSRLVAAATYTSDIEANIALGMLRSNDIPCILDGEIISGVMGIQLSPRGSIRLMVREEDLDRALSLLKES